MGHRKKLCPRIPGRYEYYRDINLNEQRTTSFERYIYLYMHTYISYLNVRLSTMIVA